MRTALHRRWPPRQPAAGADAGPGKRQGHRDLRHRPAGARHGAEQDPQIQPQVATPNGSRCSISKTSTPSRSPRPAICTPRWRRPAWRRANTSTAKSRWASTPEQVAKVLKAAKNAKGFLQIGQQLRYFPSVREVMRQLHEEKILGQMFVIRAERNSTPARPGTQTAGAPTWRGCARMVRGCEALRRPDRRKRRSQHRLPATGWRTAVPSAPTGMASAICPSRFRPGR